MQLYVAFVVAGLAICSVSSVVSDVVVHPPDTRRLTDLGGHADCPCIDPWAPFGGIPVNITFADPRTGAGCLKQTGHMGTQPACYPFDYGTRECRAWDQSQAYSCADSNGMPWSNAPSYCTDLWCWVDAGQCSLLPSTSNMFEGVSFAYSYETCGSINRFDPKVLKQSLRGRSFKVGVPGVEWPFLLVSDAGVHGGLSVDLLQHFASANQFSVTYHPVTEDSKAKFPSSSYSACVRDVALHRLDLCVGFFWDTPQRRSMVVFTPEHLQDLQYFIVFVKSEIDLLHMLVKVFEPFSPLLWLVIFACCLAVGLAMWSLGEVGDMNMVKGTVTGMRLALMTFLGQKGGFSHARTKGGKVIVFGFGFMCMLGAASYTANLASFLLMENVPTEFLSIEDAIEKGAQICAMEALSGPLFAKYPGVERSVVLVDWYDQGIDGMDDGTCQAAIISQFEYARMLAGAGYYGEDIPGKGRDAHCNKVRVGDVVLTLPLLTPIRSGMEVVMGLLVSEATTGGKIEELLQEYPLPEPVCKHQHGLKSAVAPMMPSDLMGVIILTMGFVVLGAIVHVAERHGTAHAERHAARLSTHAQGHVQRVSSRVSRSCSHNLTFSDVP